MLLGRKTMINKSNESHKIIFDIPKWTDLSLNQDINSMKKRKQQNLAIQITNKRICSKQYGSNTLNDNDNDFILLEW